MKLCLNQDETMSIRPNCWKYINKLDLTGGNINSFREKLIQGEFENLERSQTRMFHIIHII